MLLIHFRYKLAGSESIGREFREQCAIQQGSTRYNLVHFECCRTCILRIAQRIRR